MQMDIQVRIGSIISHPFCSRNQITSSSPSPSYYRSFKIFCSRRDFQEPQKDGDDNDKGGKIPTDWDKAWSNFRKQGKKTLFSQFSPDKYVSWNPRRSDYPLSEEVDPIKRTERSNLMLWTSPKFTLAGAIVIVTFLLVYTILAPVK
ncbi:2,3-bisphosphoglycerate-independent phosphoglycerate mutase [Quillaja saponaria]|uniref:2,3-bisphosphoglycerate-independent phosphoglycerate mutase n=1 Tax=Quillaja saponaria TaxID=32244 RepID=A0AAD7Q907_QUISA|nr:2,3-bisphosphoglycerate-independent phosphoglycerate mutase [Quillaja saponaria]